MCHRPDRARLLGHEAFPVPTVAETIERNLAHGRLTNPAIRCAGICLNTSQFDEGESRRLVERIAAETGLTVADPMRPGEAFERLVEDCFG